MKAAPLPDNRSSRVSRAHFDHSPLLVFYEVTRACDLVCQHCRACAQTEPHPGELSPQESRQLIDQLTEFPVPPLLVLTGGDPLKRADIFDLIEHATAAGLNVSITPSATPLVTSASIGRLQRAGVSRLAISIDGPDAASHDAVRGVPGSFARSLEILDDARRAGIPTQVNTTITPANFGRIDEMAQLLRGCRIAMWSVFFLVPVGRAAFMPRLTAEQYEEAFARLLHHSHTQAYAVKTTEAPHYRRHAIQHQLPDKSSRRRSPHSFISRGVNDGKGVMFVSHVGMVHPSGFMPIVCGCFPLQHVVRIYQRSPVFRQLRDASRLEGKCGACEFRQICGGSRSRAYATSGNPLAEEPDCAYVPAEFERS